MITKVGLIIWKVIGKMRKNGRWVGFITVVPRNARANTWLGFSTVSCASTKVFHVLIMPWKLLISLALGSVSLVMVVVGTFSNMGSWKAILPGYIGGGVPQGRLGYQTGGMGQGTGMVVLELLEIEGWMGLGDLQA